MSTNPSCSVYIGNLDQRVSNRVLYDILIQAGRVVGLHIPRDRQSEKPKGYAFAEYETEEIAEYAIKLFSGLVTLYNRTLKFAISGQGKDKTSQDLYGPLTSSPGSFKRLPPYPSSNYNVETPHHAMRLSTPSGVAGYPSHHPQVPPPSGVSPHSKGDGSHFNGTNYEYSRREVFRATLDSINQTRRCPFNATNLISPSYCFV